MKSAIFLGIVVGISLLLALYAFAHERESELASGKIAQGAIDRRSLSKPAKNTIYSCDRESMGETLDRPWVDETGVIDFSKKPIIGGSVSWDSQLKVDRQMQTDIRGNGLPRHATGTFPVERGSAAFRYDRNPNSIQAHTVDYRLPRDPKIAVTPGCLPMGTIGVALSGAVFFNALDAPGRDAVANEIFDKCEGHPERNGRYHYHHFSPCFDQGNGEMHSPLIGYALDGFGIYGPRDEGGSYVSNDQLDECHGHVGPVPLSDGTVKTVYHYHANREFPYTLGCFRGGSVVQPGRNPGARPRAAISDELDTTTLRVAAAGQERRTDATFADALSLVTLGTGGPPWSAQRAGPSALVRYGNARLLIDMGRDAQNRLQQSGVALRDLTALLFTHHHLDHNEEFVPILLKARLQGGAGDIVGPPGTQRYTDFVLDFYKEDSDYRAQRTGRSGEAMRRVNVREVNGGESFALAGLSIKTARVNHTIHTVGYRFEAGGKSIVISGDLSFSPSLIELARDADLLLIDAGQLALANTPSKGPAQRAHSTITEVAEMAHQGNVKKLVLTHFINPNPDETVLRARIGETFKGEIIFARDLLEIAP